MKYPTIISCLTAIDPKKTVAFYEKAFGFKCTNPGEDWVTMSYKDVMIMFGKEGDYGQTTKAPKTSGVESPINLYIYVDNVDDFYKNAIKNGAKSSMEPQNTDWGDRMCTVEDIDGYKWSFAQKI